jgi:ClpP class serine protease
MASAAYYIGSSASEIVVTPSGLIGAIGVYSMHEDHSQELADSGIKVSLIAAGKYKFEDNPFIPLTDEARAAIQERVDAYYALFTRDVAKGRGVSIDAVRNGFGEGRVVDAKQAVALGMADRIATLDEVIGDLVSKSPVMGSVESPRIAAEVEEIATIQAETETNAPIHAEMPAREETADERTRRLRLRLLELS